MKAKFSEDTVPISDLKINPGKIIRQIQEAHRFMRGVLNGMIDLENVFDLYKEQKVPHVVERLTKKICTH